MKAAFPNTDPKNIKRGAKADPGGRIAAALLLIGIPEHVKGYHYLYDAVQIAAVSQNKIKNHITGVLYPTIARNYGTRPGCVERAIRYAIHIAWTEGPMSHVLHEYTCGRCKKPSNGRIISLLCDRFISQPS